MNSSIKSLAVVFSCVLSTTTVALGATATYTLDPARSSLTMSGEILGTPAGPQSAGADVAQYAGTITGELNGGVLTFSGGSVIDAQLNPAGPFVPATTGVEDNYGLLAGTVPVVFRDVLLDITLGTVQHGVAPSGMSLPSSFVVDSPLASGADTDTTPNTTSALASLVTVGGIETLTIPVLRDSGAGGPLHIVLAGELVATRIVPEPSSSLLAGLALLSLPCVRRRRRTRP